MIRLPLLSEATGANEHVLEDWPAAPPWAHAPTVEWQICGHCNYDCSYCIQSRKHRVGYPDDAEIERALTHDSDRFALGDAFTHVDVELDLRLGAARAGDDPRAAFELVEEDVARRQRQDALDVAEPFLADRCVTSPDHGE